MQNVDSIIDFTLFGIYANFIMIIIAAACRFIKVSSLSNDECDEFSRFLIEYITAKEKVETVTNFRMLLGFMLNFIPTYKAYLSLVSLWYTLLYKGSKGLILSIINVERREIIKVYK